MKELLDHTTNTIYSEVSPDSGSENIQTEGADTRCRPPAVQTKPYSLIIIMMALLSVVGLVDIGVRLKTCLSDIEEPQKTCFENPSDWQEIRTSRLFYTSTEKKNWTESRKDCQRRGGDLVIINIKEKQQFLNYRYHRQSAHFNRAEPNRFARPNSEIICPPVDILRRMKLHGDSWIGLQSVNITGGRGAKKWKWQWVDGSELEYRSWNNGVSTTAEAGSKAYIDQQFLWMHSKTELKHWICEKNNISHTAIIHT